MSKVKSPLGNYPAYQRPASMIDRNTKSNAENEKALGGPRRNSDSDAGTAKSGSKFEGMERGIEGRNNSCYMDAFLTSILMTTKAFDFALNESPGENPFKKSALLKLMDVSNKLRAVPYFCSYKDIQPFKDVLAQVNPKFIGQMMDVDELINILFGSVLGVNPFIKYAVGTSNFLHQIIIPSSSHGQKDNTLQTLLEQSIAYQGLQGFASVPNPALFIAMPRSNGRLVGLDSVVPNVFLNITNLCQTLENAASKEIGFYLHAVICLKHQHYTAYIFDEASGSFLYYDSMSNQNGFGKSQVQSCPGFISFLENVASNNKPLSAQTNNYQRVLTDCRLCIYLPIDKKPGNIVPSVPPRASLSPSVSSTEIKPSNSNHESNKEETYSNRSVNATQRPPVNRDTKSQRPPPNDIKPAGQEIHANNSLPSEMQPSEADPSTRKISNDLPVGSANAKLAASSSSSKSNLAQINALNSTVNANSSQDAKTTADNEYLQNKNKNTSLSTDSPFSTKDTTQEAQSKLKHVDAVLIAMFWEPKPFGEYIKSSKSDCNQIISLITRAVKKMQSEAQRDLDQNDTINMLCANLSINPLYKMDLLSFMDHFWRKVCPKDSFIDYGEKAASPVYVHKLQWKTMEMGGPMKIQEALVKSLTHQNLKLKGVPGPGLIIFVDRDTVSRSIIPTERINLTELRPITPDQQGKPPTEYRLYSAICQQGRNYTVYRRDFQNSKAKRQWVEQNSYSSKTNVEIDLQPGGSGPSIGPFGHQMQSTAAKKFEPTNNPSYNVNNYGTVFIYINEK